MLKMDDPEINECLALMDGSSQVPTKMCSVLFHYKPIVIPGLVYKTIITGGFLQLMMTNDQYATIRFNNTIKYYESQRRGAIDYLKQEAGKATSKRLNVPVDEFLGWMKNGCIDFDTYVILRNCVLKKGFKKRMALRKEIQEAKKILSHVALATSQLIGKVDVKDFSASDPAPEPPATKPPVPKIPPRTVQVMVPKADILVKCKPEDPNALPHYKQVLCGLMFGLLAAKVFCSYLLKAMPPKLESMTMT